MDRRRGLIATAVVLVVVGVVVVGVRLVSGDAHHRVVHSAPELHLGNPPIEVQDPIVRCEIKVFVARYQRRVVRITTKLRATRRTYRRLPPHSGRARALEMRAERLGGGIHPLEQDISTFESQSSDLTPASVRTLSRHLARLEPSRSSLRPCRQ
jgi:hypothetical protein